MKLDRLDTLESESIYIIREAYHGFQNVALLSSMGKDSMTLLHLTRKAFGGDIPFPVVHIDTGCQIPGMIEWRDKAVEALDLNMIVASSDKSFDQFDDKMDCCTALKTKVLIDCIAEYGFDALILGIRGDEHGVRAKERVMSPRNADFTWNYMQQPPELWDQYGTSVAHHMRIHPLLRYTELDVWQYIKREYIDVISLYYSTNGHRYRSLGCQPCTEAVDSRACTIDEVIDEVENSPVSERSGRAQDKEHAAAMQHLRALGYM